MLAWTAPSTISQLAVPMTLKLLRSLPLNNVTQPSFVWAVSPWAARPKIASAMSDRRFIVSSRSGTLYPGIYRRRDGFLAAFFFGAAFFVILGAFDFFVTFVTFVAFFVAFVVPFARFAGAGGGASRFFECAANIAP